MRVRNNRPNATNPGYGGAWKANEVRVVPEDIGFNLVRIAGFDLVPDEVAPVKTAEPKPKAKKRSRKTKKE